MAVKVVVKSADGFEGGVNVGAELRKAQLRLDNTPPRRVGSVDEFDTVLAERLVAVAGLIAQHAGGSGARAADLGEAIRLLTRFSVALQERL